MSGNHPSPLWILTPESAPLSPMQSGEAATPSERLLKRLGRATALLKVTKPWSHWLLNRLSIDTPPWAALWLASYGNPLKDSEQGLVISPVQMDASLNAVSVRASHLGHDSERAKRWEDILSPLLSETGGRVERVHGETLLRLPTALKVKTLTLHETLGQDLRDCLPQGEDHKILRRWMTECQMALHDGAIPGINGVWFWGESHPLASPLQLSTPSNIQDPWLRALVAFKAPADEIRHDQADRTGLFEDLEDALKQHSRLDLLFVRSRGEAVLYRLSRRDVLRFWRSPVTIDG